MEMLIRLYDAYEPGLWLALAVIVLLLFLWLGVLQVRLNRLARGSGEPAADTARGERWQERLQDYLAQARHTSARVDDLTEVVRRLEQASRHSLRGVGVVRFNPFGDTGGDQSFALALLNAHRNGLVISSLRSRSESRVYAKPVENGESTYALSSEEKEAIQRALQSMASTSASI